MTDTKGVRGCIIERNGKYHVVVSYYVGGYRQHQTKSTGIAVNAHKKREAEKMLDSLVQEKKRELEELARKNNSHSFADCFEKWIEYKSKQIECTTAAVYVNRTKTIIEYFRRKDVSIEELQSKDLLAYYEWALAHGRRHTYNENAPTGLSRTTVSDQAVMIKRFLRDAVSLGIINANPADCVSVPRVRADNVKEIAFMDLEEANTFLEYVKTVSMFEKLYHITRLGICYGFRRSELLGLKWDAIDFEKNEIEIRHTIVKADHGDVQRDNVKSKSSHRYLPLLEYVKKDLSDLKESQKKLGIYSENGYVFKWEDGKPYRTDYITSLFKKAVLRCGVVPENLTLHGLRHSCCAILAEQGWDLGKVHNWLGHADIATTANIYNHVTKKWRNKHGELANEIFK